MKNRDNQSWDSRLYWKTTFGKILRTLFDIYGVSDRDFQEYSGSQDQYEITDSAVRKWFAGQRLPQKKSLQIIIRFFEFINDKPNDHKKDNCIYTAIENYFSDRHLTEFYRIREKNKDIIDFIRMILQYCVSNAKSSANSNEMELFFSPTGKTKAIVFDFDGTLTRGKHNKTTWESIWTTLGYQITDCQNLQLRFISGEISHEEWCQLTEDKFIERQLHKSQIECIAKKIKLLPGVKETFAMLEANDIKIYIVSGSIYDIIKKVLGNSIYHYVDGIKANHFFYNDNGILSKIVGTKYDFEGKANFIREISTELHISTEDVLFVGNSFNDRFAYQSGARTLCINPKETDPTNLLVWNCCLKDCNDLRDIKNHIYF